MFLLAVKMGYVVALLRFYALAFRFRVKFCGCPAVEGTVVPRAQFA
jgi:hypothetical protein